MEWIIESTSNKENECPINIDYIIMKEIHNTDFLLNTSLISLQTTCTSILRLCFTFFELLVYYLYLKDLYLSKEN